MKKGNNNFWESMGNILLVVLYVLHLLMVGLAKVIRGIAKNTSKKTWSIACVVVGVFLMVAAAFHEEMFPNGVWGIFAPLIAMGIPVGLALIAGGVVYAKED